MTQSRGGDPEVVGSDQVAVILELRPDFRVGSSNRGRDRQRLDRGDHVLDERGATSPHRSRLGAVHPMQELTGRD